MPNEKWRKAKLEFVCKCVEFVCVCVYVCKIHIKTEIGNSRKPRNPKGRKSKEAQTEIWSLRLVGEDGYIGKSFILKGSILWTQDQEQRVETNQRRLSAAQWLVIKPAAI